MYYISSITGDQYGVIDTRFGTERFYSRKGLSKISKKHKIHGVLEDTIKVFNLEALVLKYKLAGQGFKYIINGDDIILTKYTGTVSDFVVPDFITKIGKEAFGWYDNLKSVTILDNVRSIGNFAFFYCSSLESIKIPDSITSIGVSAFGDCDSLTTINIPDGVASIGNNAFKGCNNLKEIEIPEICKFDSDSFPKHTKVVIRRA